MQSDLICERWTIRRVDVTVYGDGLISFGFFPSSTCFDRKNKSWSSPPSRHFRCHFRHPFGPGEKAKREMVLRRHMLIYNIYHLPRTTTPSSSIFCPTLSRWDSIQWFMNPSNEQAAVRRNDLVHPFHFAFLKD